MVIIADFSTSNLPQGDIMLGLTLADMANGQNLQEVLFTARKFTYRPGKPQGAKTFI